MKNVLQCSQSVMDLNSNANKLEGLRNGTLLESGRLERVSCLEFRM